MSQSDEIYSVRIKIRMNVFLEVSFISARGTQKDKLHCVIKCQSYAVSIIYIRNSPHKKKYK